VVDSTPLTGFNIKIRLKTHKTDDFNVFLGRGTALSPYSTPVPHAATPDPPHGLRLLDLPPLLSDNSQSHPVSDLRTETQTTLFMFVELTILSKKQENSEEEGDRLRLLCFAAK